MPSPLGASSFTFATPPAMNLGLLTLPSGEISEMKPLLSASPGLPLMFETK